MRKTGAFVLGSDAICDQQTNNAQLKAKDGKTPNSFFY